MIKIIRNLLSKIIDDIDSSNSNISQGEVNTIIVTIKSLSDKTQRISKYGACRYINISRTTFDNYVKDGKLPRGEHHIGFKELSWSKKDLDKYIKEFRNKNKTK